MQTLPKPSDRRFKDWEGVEVGRLKIGGYCGRGSGCSLWEYSCKCGRRGVISSVSLRRGLVGCGCGRNDPKSHMTHGMTDTTEYEIWCGIKKRCFNPKCKAYPRYGGRGITMHPSWKASFEKFYEDVGPRPSRKSTLDRINNDGHYEPGNVRWSDRKTQARNRSSSRLVNVNGEIKALAEWSEISGVGRDTIKGRLNAGWDAELAVYSKAWEIQEGACCGKKEVDARGVAGGSPEATVDSGEDCVCWLKWTVRRR